jgi:hypothetical protein
MSSRRFLWLNHSLFFFTAAVRATLALPDVLTPGTGDRLRWMFLCQRLPTNWTILRHIFIPVFSLTKGSNSKVTFKRPEFASLYQLEQKQICSFLYKCSILDALVCSRILVRRVLLLQVRRVQSRSPGQIESRNSSWSCSQFQDDF